MWASIVTRHDHADRNELNKAVLSTRVTQQWILMNFFISKLYCAKFRNNIFPLPQVQVLNILLKSNYFTWWQLLSWVSALSFAVKFTPCSWGWGSSSVSHLIFFASSAPLPGIELPRSAPALATVCLRHKSAQVECASVSESELSRENHRSWTES